MAEINGAKNYFERLLTRAQGVSAPASLSPLGWSGLPKAVPLGDPFAAVAIEPAGVPAASSETIKPTLRQAAAPDQKVMPVYAREDSVVVITPTVQPSPISKSDPLAEVTTNALHLQSVVTPSTQDRREKSVWPEATNPMKPSPVSEEPRRIDLPVPEIISHRSIRDISEKSATAAFTGSGELQPFLPKTQKIPADLPELQTDFKINTNSEQLKSRLQPGRQVPPPMAEQRPLSMAANQTKTADRGVTNIQPRAAVKQLSPRPQQRNTTNPRKAEAGPRLVIDRLRVEVVPMAASPSLPVQPAKLGNQAKSGQAPTRRTVSQLRFGLGQF